ncbi:hypothetical protein [Catenulispora subtropica]|uniref:ESX secretion-associated protein EspG n=1 Tax=Catenulispora subtropica TaxID=450798 RepID=A0ABP5EIR8_9ACTN
MTGGPALDAGIGFSLRVPPNWFELDVHPATREASVRDLVRDRIAQVPELQERRREITKLLSDQAARSWDAGAVYCAGMAEPVEDGVLPASVTVFLLPGPLGASSDEPDRTAALLPMLTPKEPKDDDDTWTKVRVFDLEGCGQAVRTYGIEDVEPEPGKPIRIASMQTFVPVPDVNRVLLVSCSSPAFALAEGLFDLFDALTGTLRLHDS